MLVYNMRKNEIRPVAATSSPETKIKKIKSLNNTMILYNKRRHDITILIIVNSNSLIIIHRGTGFFLCSVL